MSLLSLTSLKLPRPCAKALQMQMAKDRTVIGRHIRNAIKEGEIDSKTICAKFAHITQHGAKSLPLAPSCNR